jgi:uncharacterized protein YbjQ (UPF0145 family)
MRISSLTAAVLVFAACAPAFNLSPEERRHAAAIPLLSAEDVGQRRFSVIKEVVGRSCAWEDGEQPSASAARDELKIEAAAVSANAVTGVLCKQGGLDIAHNCQRVVECRGDAIRWL